MTNEPNWISVKEELPPPNAIVYLMGIKADDGESPATAYFSQTNPQAHPSNTFFPDPQNPSTKFAFYVDETKTEVWNPKCITHWAYIIPNMETTIEIEKPNTVQSSPKWHEPNSSVTLSPEMFTSTEAYHNFINAIKDSFKQGEEVMLTNKGEVVAILLPPEFMLPTDND